MASSTFHCDCQIDPWEIILFAIREKGTSFVALFPTDHDSMGPEHPPGKPACAVAGKLLLTSKRRVSHSSLVCPEAAPLTTDLANAVQHASQLQSLLELQSGSKYLEGSHNSSQQTEAAKLICKCRHGLISLLFRAPVLDLSTAGSCCSSAILNA